MPTLTSEERKNTPVASGVLDYFPLALQAVARLSKKGNDKHNPGEPLHWAREKSNDHRDCIARHLMECGHVDPETGELHEVALAWRALANLQIAEEKRIANKEMREFESQIFDEDSVVIPATIRLCERRKIIAGVVVRCSLLHNHEGDCNFDPHP